MTDDPKAEPRRIEALREQTERDRRNAELIQPFEDWWATHPYCNRDTAGYREKKQIAWDAFKACRALLSEGEQT